MKFSNFILTIPGASAIIFQQIDGNSSLVENSYKGWKNAHGDPVQCKDGQQGVRSDLGNIACTEEEKAWLACGQAKQTECSANTYIQGSADSSVSLTQGMNWASCVCSAGDCQQFGGNSVNSECMNHMSSLGTCLSSRIQYDEQLRTENRALYKGISQRQYYLTLCKYPGCIDYSYDTCRKGQRRGVTWTGRIDYWTKPKASKGNVVAFNGGATRQPGYENGSRRRYTSSKTNDDQYNSGSYSSNHNNDYNSPSPPSNNYYNSNQNRPSPSPSSWEDVQADQQQRLDNARREMQQTGFLQNAFLNPKQSRPTSYGGPVQPMVQPMLGGTFVNRGPPSRNFQDHATSANFRLQQAPAEEPVDNFKYIGYKNYTDRSVYGNKAETDEQKKWLACGNAAQEACNMKTFITFDGEDTRMQGVKWSECACQLSECQEAGSEVQCRSRLAALGACWGSKGNYSIVLAKENKGIASKYLSSNYTSISPQDYDTHICFSPGCDEYDGSDCFRKSGDINWQGKIDYWTPTSWEKDQDYSEIDGTNRSIFNNEAKTEDQKKWLNCGIAASKACDYSLMDGPTFGECSCSLTACQGLDHCATRFGALATCYQSKVIYDDQLDDEDKEMGDGISVKKYDEHLCKQDGCKEYAMSDCEHKTEGTWQGDIDFWTPTKDEKEEENDAGRATDQEQHHP